MSTWCCSQSWRNVAISISNGQQQPSDVVMLTSRTRCEFNVLVSTPYLISSYSVRRFNIHDIYSSNVTFYSTLTQHRHNVSQYRRCKDAVNLTSRFQRCRNVVNKTSIVHCELNLLSKFEETFDQRCNFDVVASTSLQRCVRRCNLTTTQFPVDLFTFTEEILTGKLHFLCIVQCAWPFEKLCIEGFKLVDCFCVVVVTVYFDSL